MCRFQIYGITLKAVWTSASCYGNVLGRLETNCLIEVDDAHLLNLQEITSSGMITAVTKHMDITGILHAGTESEYPGPAIEMNIPSLQTKGI